MSKNLVIVGRENSLFNRKGPLAEPHGGAAMRGGREGRKSGCGREPEMIND